MDIQENNTFLVKQTLEQELPPSVVENLSKIPSVVENLAENCRSLGEEEEAFLKRLYARSPQLEKILTDPNSYNEDGSLKVNYLALANRYDIRVRQVTASRERLEKKTDFIVENAIKVESISTRRHLAFIKLETESHEAKMDLLAKLEAKMIYEMIWDPKEQAKVSMLVPKRM